MRVTPIIASRFMSDGGTMFGLVPKPIWSKRLAADDQNRIPQHAHVLLVELEDGRVGLVDSGCGSSECFTERSARLHALEPGWPLLDALRTLGHNPERIDFVIFTHLHWDHAGGAGAPPGMGRIRSFPNARHVAHRMEWQDACGENPLLYKSYPPETIAPLREGPLDLVDGDESEILPGIRMLRTSGHTRGHCAVSLTHPRLRLAHPNASDFEGVTRLLMAGDVCPTRHHLRMVFQTSYDTHPLETRAWKRAWMPRIARERMLLMFNHDPEVFGACIRADDKEEFVADRLLACP